MATGKPCKNTTYFGFNCSYFKNERGDPHFLFLKYNQHARMKPSAKFKNFYGADSEPPEFFKTLQRVSSWPADHFCAIKNLGH